MRDHAGWSTNSKMPEIYLHYFGTESCKSLLETYGINKQENSQALHLSVQCPGCKESNKPNSSFCTRCKTVLKYDLFIESLKEERCKELEIKSLKEKLESVQQEQDQKISQIMKMIKYNPKLARLKKRRFNDKKTHE